MLMFGEYREQHNHLSLVDNGPFSISWNSKMAPRLGGIRQMKWFIHSSTSMWMLLFFSLSFGAKFKFQYIENGPLFQDLLLGLLIFQLQLLTLKGWALLQLFWVRMTASQGIIPDKLFTFVTLKICFVQYFSFLATTHFLLNFWRQCTGKSVNFRFFIILYLKPVLWIIYREFKAELLAKHSTFE